MLFFYVYLVYIVNLFIFALLRDGRIDYYPQGC